ncbi:MAG TPA: pyridoxal-phosphate dependent enzyme [Rhodothermales bacterium]|nr:pyridoxal-phosphate dependent enzyme [Rhodothermales bacterium]
MWHENILGTIGSTPLVKLNRVATDIPGTVLTKVEYFNPGASVKDRIGIAMIEEAERTGKLKPGGTVIECTSGNTGTGLALVAIAKGYRCIFTTTDKQSREKVDVLRALGAEVIVCPTNVAPDDPKSYYSVAARLHREIENSFHANQYENPANTEAHYRSTGPELWEQTDHRITHFFVGAGTGGTISGTSRYLKEQSEHIKVIGIDPYGSVYYKYFHSREFDDAEIYPYITEGVGEDILAGNMDFDLIDDYVRVTDREAMMMTRKLAVEEGLFVGGSSGLAVAGALQWMRAHKDELSESAVHVILLPDSGFRYLSKIFNDAWMRDHGFAPSRAGLTAMDIIEARARPGREVVSVDVDEPMSAAIEKMTAIGVSQIPVRDNGMFVGSLTESGILARLIDEPDARRRPAGEVMSKPFPIVPRTMHIDELSGYLEHEAGAVLVEGEDPNEFYIITKTDLINSLFRLGRNN